MKQKLVFDKEYTAWLGSIKERVRAAQIKAAVRVNSELLLFYWSLGADIVEKQAQAAWGDGLIEQLSRDLTVAFPGMKGFSRANLMYIKKWYLFYRDGGILVQQPVGQLQKQPGSHAPAHESLLPPAGHQPQPAVLHITQIPWGHNIAIITNCKNTAEALFYVNNTIRCGWSRSVLEHQMESGLYAREGKAVNNFAGTLPQAQSDLALQTLKDPYVFDFLTLTEKHDEKDLENALVEHITKFLLELGAGFAYVGRQVPLRVGESDFYIDLLLYHLKLRSYVVVELKTTAFQPEFAGKLNFYLKAVDTQMRTAQDAASIGILICKKKDKVVAEYALSDIQKPIGVSVYKLTQSLPKKFKPSLPSIKDIEKELRTGGGA